MKPGTLVRLLRGTQYEKAVLWKLLEIDRHGYATIEPTQPYRLAHPFGWPVYSTEKQVVFHTRIEEVDATQVDECSSSGDSPQVSGVQESAEGAEEGFPGCFVAGIRSGPGLHPASGRGDVSRASTVDRSLFPPWPFPGGYPQEMPE